MTDNEKELAAVIIWMYCAGVITGWMLGYMPRSWRKAGITWRKVFRKE
jgi:predicted membrane protein